VRAYYLEHWAHPLQINHTPTQAQQKGSTRFIPDQPHTIATNVAPKTQSPKRRLAGLWGRLSIMAHHTTFRAVRV
jgi:hypothetical protein